MAFKKARQSLRIRTLKYVPARGLEHFHRPQRRNRERHASLYSWCRHVFLIIFDGSEPETHNVSRSLIVLLRWGAVKAIHTNAFPWTPAQKIVQTRVFMLWNTSRRYFPFRGHSDGKRVFHELASFVHKTVWVCMSSVFIISSCPQRRKVSMRSGVYKRFSQNSEVFLLTRGAT